MITNKAIDFIGDIHGNASKLILLLNKLGYFKDNEGWKHPEDRHLLVLGDFINVGPQSKEVLSILRELWSKSRAHILIGNHEYYLAWNYRKYGSGVFDTDGPLKIEYEGILHEFKDHRELLKEYCEWFLELPLYIETDSFRAVHAYWSAKNGKKLLKYKKMSDYWTVFSEDEKKKSKKLKRIISETISGKMAMFFNPCRMEKPEYYRVKWWKDLYGKDLKDSIMVNKKVKCPSIPINSEILPDFEPYGENEKPIFFGHYWFKNLPFLLRNNACCLDFGAAKGGYLTAYRWNGEQVLDANNLIWV